MPSGSVAAETPPPSDATLSASYSRLPEIDGDIHIAPQRPPFSWGKFWYFMGPGWLMSMAYLDPGNLEADLQSGAYSRYELLYVTFWSTVLGGLYQVLAARLGSCTGHHLAEICRAAYPRVVTYAVWIMMELVIIGCDIQEIIWAVGLVASGQASTMTGTYAGQFVMEGFLDLRIAAWKRVAITRVMALGPALVVALLTEYDGFHSDIVSEMINVMQSVQLPFALVPLLTFIANKRLMGELFVYNRCIITALVVGTLVLFGVNYTLVFKTLQQTFALSTNGWMIVAVVAVFYGALVLYLIAFPFLSWYKAKWEDLASTIQHADALQLAA
ncbi:hypothetical protein BBP00_00004866 [Phytophthora kernoviae]|uniref:Uncharacterized protein n=1 Tax=Phytophthora kernoviae TaxID=325452 RepID=A0A3F2RSC0_9STRA|nr:hypothetical protein BBP00_00004866 [Phytophthora kernoviae]